MKLALSAGAIALSMALVGCGGGGSSGPSSMMMEQEDTDKTPVELRRAAEDAVKAAEDAVAALSEEPTGEAIVAARGLITTAQAAIAMAPEADREGFNTRLSELDSGLATAQMAVDGPSEEQVTEMDGRAAGLHEALTQSDGASDVLGTRYGVTLVRLPVDRANNAANNIVITRGLSGGFDLMRERTGWLDPATDAASLGGTGWAGKTLAHSGEEQSITVYSNIKTATREDFAADSATSIYRAGQGAASILHLPGASTNAIDDSNPVAVLTLPADDMEGAYEQGLLDSRYFPKAGAPGSAAVTYTYNNDLPAGLRNRKASFPGTFHGASGDYACTDTTCSIIVTPPTLLAPATYAATGAWSFTPEAEATDGNDAQLIAQDEDWLSFGWWIDEPKSADPRGGEYLYNAQVFYAGADQYAFASIANLLRDNATYKGRAAGLYARTADPDNDIASARGEFAADASLTARFGIPGSPDTASIGGTINSFTNGDGVDMSEWSLTLQPETVATQGADGDGSGVTGEILSGDATNIAGSWEAQLYGPTPGDNMRPAQPTGVAGRFFANIDSDTAVAGGFGATKQ